MNNSTKFPIAPKERVILCTGAEVRTILSGQKTQMRHICKPQPFDRSFSKHGHSIGYVTGRIDEGDEVDGFYAFSKSGGGQWSSKCPFGAPGDRLRVYETWADLAVLSDGQFSGIIYRADDVERYGDEDEYVDVTAPAMKWRSSTHMPRWASRITLEIVSVRIERLQDISEADAMAEGARRFDEIPIGTQCVNPSRWSMESPTDTDKCLDTARFAFANMFCKSGRGVIDYARWDDNPMVWVITFMRVTP